MARDRQIIAGDPGTVWTNDTDRPRYQFIASLVNTCGACLQYHMQIGPFWGIPLHYGCRCRQAAVPPGAQAPHPFVDYRELLDAMPADQQKAAVGASNWRLIESGVVEWKDVVTSARVRSLREVVALKKLSVKAMTDVGVGRVFAERAYESVHTAAHEIATQTRSAAEAAARSAGMTAQQLADELAKRLGSRVGITLPATATNPAPVVQRFGGHGTAAAALARAMAAQGVVPAIVAPAAAPLPIRACGKVTATDEREMRKILDSLPPAVAEQLRDAGVRCVVADKFSSYDRTAAAQQARGYPPGWTMEDVGVGFHWKRKTLIVSRTVRDPVTKQYEPADFPPGVVRHELGHALDSALRHASSGADFRAAYHADLADVPGDEVGNIAYYYQRGQAGPREAFAEVFAELHGGSGSNPSVRAVSYFPRCAALVRRICEGLGP